MSWDFELKSWLLCVKKHCLFLYSFALFVFAHTGCDAREREGEREAAFFEVRRGGFCSICVGQGFRDRDKNPIHHPSLMPLGF